MSKPTMNEAEEHELKDIEDQITNGGGCWCRACIHDRMQRKLGLSSHWRKRNCAQYNRKAW